MRIDCNMALDSGYFLTCIIAFAFGTVGISNALSIDYKKARFAGLAPLFYMSLAN